MASNRWVAIDPDILSHPLVGAGQPVEPADKTRGAYSRLEAWLWLVFNASFSDHTVINRGRKMTLKRGDLLGGWLYLATTWNWSREAVRWWIGKLIADDMVRRATLELQRTHNGVCENHNTQHNTYYGNQAQILTLVNYWRFQFQSYEQQQPTYHAEPPPNPNRTTTEQHHITKEHGNKGRDRGADAPLAHAVPTRTTDAHQAIDLYNEAARRHGFTECHSRPSSRLGRLQKRLRDIGGLEPFKRALSAIHLDDFLSGRVRPRNGRSPFKLDLDRLLQTDGNMGDVLAKLVDEAVTRGRAAGAANGADAKARREFEEQLAKVRAEEDDASCRS